MTRAQAEQIPSADKVNFVRNGDSMPLAEPMIQAKNLKWLNGLNYCRYGETISNSVPVECCRDATKGIENEPRNCHRRKVAESRAK